MLSRDSAVGYRLSNAICLACVIGRKTILTRLEYWRDNHWRQLETLIALSEEHPMYQWISIEEIGASWEGSEVKFLRKVHR